MEFRLHHAAREGGMCHFTLLFTSRSQTRMEMRLSFPDAWEHKVNGAKDERIAPLLQGISFVDSALRSLNAAQAETMPKAWVESVFLSIPHDLCRVIFHRVLNAWAQMTLCALDVRFEKNPGYDLTVVRYNKKIIASDKVIDIIQSLLTAISQASLEQTAESDTTLLHEEDAEEEANFDDRVVVSDGDESEGTTITEWSGTLGAGTLELFDAFSEAAATRVQDSPSPIALPRNTLYSSSGRWSTLEKIYAQNAGNKFGELMSRLPSSWFRMHKEYPAKWCRLHAWQAYLELLSNDQQHLSEQEVAQLYPDYVAQVHPVDASDKMCLVLDSAYGALLIDMVRPYLER